jgi:hypothetical protein
MTQDEIIEMAREVGGREVDEDDPQCSIGKIAFDLEELAALFKLAAAKERERIKEENQRCYVARGQA